MFKIIFFSIIFFTAHTKKVIVFAIEYEPNVVLITLECSKEVGFDLSNLYEIAHSGFPSKDNAVRDFFFCGLKRKGISNDDGDIDIPNFLRVFPPEQMSSIDKTEQYKIISECMQKEGTPADKAYGFIQCYSQKAPAQMALPHMGSIGRSGDPKPDSAAKKIQDFYRSISFAPSNLTNASQSKAA